MKKLPLLISSALLVISLFSCSNENELEQNTDNINATNIEVSTEKFEIFSGNWILKDIALNSEIKLIPPSTVNIEFSKEENDSIINYVLNGSSTCNLYGGKFLSLGSNTISFEQLYNTEILCEDDLNNFEVNYFELLFKSEEYSIEGSMLTLFSIDNVTINYERSKGNN